MRKALEMELRAMFRDEIRLEIERHLNPTFIGLVKDGTEDMKKIFDAVIECDDRHRAD